MQKINVCIVDDHNLFRKAIVRLIKTFNCIGEVTDAGNGKECLELFKKNTPDVVLLDLEMPVMNGVDTAEILVTKYPELKIIILTMHDSENYILHLMEMGVHSILLKNTDPTELEKAILSVVEKDFYHNELISSVLRKSVIGHAKAERPVFAHNKLALLSEREKIVVTLLCRNESTNKEIAEKMNLSLRTIEGIRADIFEKLELKSAVGLVKFAYHAGLMGDF